MGVRTDNSQVHCRQTSRSSPIRGRCVRRLDVRFTDETNIQAAQANSDNFGHVAPAKAAEAPAPHLRRFRWIPAGPQGR